MRLSASNVRVTTPPNESWTTVRLLAASYEFVTSVPKLSLFVNDLERIVSSRDRAGVVRRRQHVVVRVEGEGQHVLGDAPLIQVSPVSRLSRS